MNTPSHVPASFQTGAMTWPQWRLVFLLMAICGLSHFNRISMTTAADLRIMPEYGLDETQMGWVYSAFLIAYTLCMIPCGWLIDRRGPLFCLAIVSVGSAVFIVGTAAASLATTANTVLILLLVSRSLMGVVSSPVHPAAAKALSLEIPLERRSASNGMVTGAAVLGVAVTHVVFGALVDRFNWAGAFLVAAAVTAGLGLLWLMYAPPSAARPANSHAHPAAHSRAPYSRREIANLTLLTLSYAAVGYFQYLFFYWIHFYFLKELDLGDAESRYYAGIPNLFMALGMPLGGWLADRIESLFGWRAARAGMVASAMFASAALLWIGVRAGEPLWIVAWLSLSMGTLGMAEGPLWVTAVEIGGRRGGLSSSIFNAGGNAGGILAPIVTPWVSVTLGYGWQAGISLGSVVCFAGALCWLWIQPPDNLRRDAETTTGASESRA
jgi:MFS transporter, ACS family, D-galactonate transporter